MNATDRIRIAHISFEHFMCHVRMAVDTVMLQNLFILSLDHDRLMKILQGKAFRVVVAVFRFRNIFGNKCMWKMAVNASGHMMMA